MCLGDWSVLGFIEYSNIQEVVLMPEVSEAQGDEDGDILMPEGWNDIHT